MLERFEIHCSKSASILHFKLHSGVKTGRKTLDHQATIKKSLVQYLQALQTPRGKSFACWQNWHDWFQHIQATEGQFQMYQMYSASTVFFKSLILNKILERFLLAKLNMAVQFVSCALSLCCTMVQLVRRSDVSWDWGIVEGILC